MAVIHLVSHTHWDREWYRTFQSFRLRLVRMIDTLLVILERDPGYLHFMLDGQTVALEDYLEVRPEQAGLLKRHVESGRILAGPWHVLPDEFLVSGESLIRNLLRGASAARRFGAIMETGYIPDPFGHIGQMPQILRGFGIRHAAFRRGLSGEPCELWWESPDGSRVLAAYLRDGYDNARALPSPVPGRTLEEIIRLRDSLVPHSLTGHLLFMHGADHSSPDGTTSSMIAETNLHLPDDVIVHSTLPAYMEAVERQVRDEGINLPVARGELRSPRRHHLLPGVLSTRMWIKQENRHCETLLEKWAEPLAVWAGACEPGGHASTAHMVRHAWRMLMENHPHDSICGCSIDPVHEEMRQRFSRVREVGEEIITLCLAGVAGSVDTRPARMPGGGISAPDPFSRMSALLVFNPTGAARTDLVRASVRVPSLTARFSVMDGEGRPCGYEFRAAPIRELAAMELDREGMRSVFNLALCDGIPDLYIRDAEFSREGDALLVQVLMDRMPATDPSAAARLAEEMERHLGDAGIAVFRVRAALSGESGISFVAHNVPPHGYAAYWLLPETKPLPVRENPAGPHSIENDYLSVAVSPENGTLSVRDKRTGMTFQGLNAFSDGGDRGDLYNYCPPGNDRVVDTSREAAVRSIDVVRSSIGSSVSVSLSVRVPAELAPGRDARSEETVSLEILTRITLIEGVPRADIRTVIGNRAKDHRLRALFPVPFAADHADHDGHFEVTRRGTRPDASGPDWAEDPRPEVPQCAFTDVSDGAHGLMVANRGLPEVEIHHDGGRPRIALTLLRCTGWLSRDDFPSRRGHAGPPLMETPGAQMQGTYEFHYSIIPHEGGWERALHHAHEFAAPLRCTATGIHPGPLPGTGYFVRSSTPLFVISAIKPADDGGGFIVRGYNIGDEELAVSLELSARFTRVFRATLNESPAGVGIPFAEGTVDLTARGHEIVTLRFE